MPALGATDPADLVTLARAELGITHQLEQPHRALPPPANGGSSRYPLWFCRNQQQQQQQLKKLGIIIYYLDKFNHNRSLHTPRAQGQTALESELPERASLLPGYSPGYVWLCSHTTVVYCKVNARLYVVGATATGCCRY